ncbi:MAG: hypothetical protein J5601_04815 [Elusimicrobiaceae bacterium]|nr:hypothetical protein [Elusimicrobiaceae bacterium]
MKKLITLTITSALVLIGTTFAQAKETSVQELTSSTKKAAVKQRRLYADDRVQQMCAEWPSCQEWVGLKSANTVSFQLVDTEVSHWISGWNGKEAVWGHRFYAQTRENGQTKAYEFLRLTDKNGKNVNYLPPTEMRNKFPGHPLPQEPSTHALMEDPGVTFPVVNLCKAWPGCMDAIYERKGDLLNNDFGIVHVVRTQYISKWDAQGNAYWARGLWVEFAGWISHTTLYFSAHQTKPGEAYSYHPPKQVKHIPSIPSNFRVWPN